ncbi:unnamed protein product [Rodentolepis nana]|uniref:CUE domain-containing protein n=1 Tax=Rodentolepis nana TaxID=102285 RepID=A0A0R3T089_RODNA|nr:unnamed protein product [Rodentolepis nana]
MSTSERSNSLPPDYVLVPNRLHHNVSNWSLCDLDKIVSALERDNMLSMDELHLLLPNIKPEEIDQLINFCLSNNKADFPDYIESDPVVFEENSLEIAKNSIRAVSSPLLAPGSAVSSVLSDIAKNECDKELATMCNAKNLCGQRGLISPNYARIYTYLSDLFNSSHSGHNLENQDIVAIVDMIYCLLQSADYLVNQVSFSDLDLAFSDIMDKIGILLSAISSSYHHRCVFLKRMTNLPIYDIESLVEKFPTDSIAMAMCRVNSLPYTAPMLVMKETQLPCDITKCLRLKAAVRNKFEEYWDFKYFNEDDGVEKVQKELAAFSVNPFGLSMETVPSLQKYFDSLNSSMSQFEKAVSSRAALSSSVVNPDSNSVHRSLIQSAAKLIAKCQPCRNGLVRRVSEPVDRSEIDKFFKTLNVSRTIAKPLTERRRSHSKNSSTSSGQPPSKMYKRVP